MNQINKIVLTTSIALAHAVPGVALAQITGANSGVPENFQSFQNIIRTTFRLTILGSGILFVLLLLLGGVQYLTSLGNEDGTTKARKLMISALIGLVIVLSAFALGTYILGLLGFENNGDIPVEGL